MILKMGFPCRITVMCSQRMLLCLDQCTLSFLLPSTVSSCRLLEADSKSMRSMSGSRRNSGSSLVSSSSASSNLSHLEEDTWILWGRIVNEWEEWRRKKDKLLKVGIGVWKEKD